MTDHRRGDDRGNISILTLGFLVVVMVLVLTVSAATAVHMQRMRLQHLADESALSAADSLDLARYYAGAVAVPTEHAGVTLSQPRMVQAVQHHVALENDRLGTDRVRIIDVVVVDEHTARVTLQASVMPLFGIEALAPFANGITITVVGTARAF